MPDVLTAPREAGCVLYDYTKRPVPDAAAHGVDLTYAYPGGEGTAARRYLDAGHRVAVVFATRKGAEPARRMGRAMGRGVPRDRWGYARSAIYRSGRRYRWTAS